MAIKAENKRVILTMPESLHQQISDLAEKENRSVSNYVVTLLKKHIEQNK